MEKVVNDRRLMIGICDLYYNQKLTHLQIAERLHISRPTVSKLLSAAMKEKIVDITVKGLETAKYWELEQQVEKRYNLRDVFIVDAQTNQADVLHALGNVARTYLDSLIKDGDVVGVSMGKTLYHTVYSDYPSNVKKASDVLFVPLIGGMGDLRSELHSNHLAEGLAKAYQGKFLSLYAPARISNTAIRNYLKKEPSVASVLQWHKQLDVAIVGIGYPNDQSSVKATGYYKDNEIQSLLERKVIGEICMQFYDIQGSTLAYKKDNNVVGIELNKLKKVPYSIGVAEGIDKVPAIKGAIRGGYVNVLVIDNQCAEMLLKED